MIMLSILMSDHTGMDSITVTITDPTTDNIIIILTITEGIMDIDHIIDMVRGIIIEGEVVPVINFLNYLD